MDIAERKNLAAIAANTGRIADVMEAILADARASRDIDVSKVLADATAALRKANPAFDMAFTAMEQHQLKLKELG